MKKLTAVEALRDSIQLLELEQTAKGLILKEHLYNTYETLKPINILKKTLSEISSSPYLVDNIMGTSMGIASGFLTNRIFVGASGNLIRKLLGSILQFGVTNAVAQHPESIKSVGQLLLQLFHRRKRVKSDQSVN